MQDNQIIDLMSKKTQKERDHFNDILSDVEFPLLEGYLERFGVTKEYREYIETQKKMIEFVESVMLMIKFSNTLIHDNENDKALKCLNEYKIKLNQMIGELNELLKKFSYLQSKFIEQGNNGEG